MKSPVIGEIVAQRSMNAVETAVAAQFPAELWSADEPVRIQGGDGIGLHPHFFYPSIEAGNDRMHPEWEWVALLYGSRIAGGGGDEPIRFESVPLEVLPDIHEYLSQTVLAGEHVRPSKFVTPPIPDDLLRAPRNGLFWLQQMTDGHWGLMCYPSSKAEPDGTRKIVYSKHDYQVYHSPVFMTLARESQALIGDVAKYQHAWLQSCIDDETGELIRLDISFVPRLPGDTYDKDPYNAGHGKNGEGPYRDGMWLIDVMTDDVSHLLVLHYLMHDQSGTTPEERLQALEAYAEAGKRDGDATTHRAAQALIFMRKLHHAMANFVKRHESRRNITPDEARAVYEDYTRGTVRVAKKIAGTWTTTDEIADQQYQLRGVCAPLGRSAIV